jgi:biopolymer transport protein ExbD
MFKKPVRRPPGSLNITSMMDMFTIILVFLLKNFATEGNLMTSADHLLLPVSKKADSPQEVSMNIVVDHDWILVDDQRIMETKAARSQDSLVLAPVLSILEEKRAEEEMAELAKLVEPSAGLIAVQIDKNMEYDVVTKIAATCGFAKYANIKFAVTKLEEEE